MTSNNIINYTNKFIENNKHSISKITIKKLFNMYNESNKDKIKYEEFQNILLNNEEYYKFDTKGKIVYLIINAHLKVNNKQPTNNNKETQEEINYRLIKEQQERYLKNNGIVSFFD